MATRNEEGRSLRRGLSETRQDQQNALVPRASEVIVPALVILCGIIGAFVGLQRRLKGLSSVGYQDYAKLFVWSFIAGYFEHFVTDVLGRLEGRPWASCRKVSCDQSVSRRRQIRMIG